MRSLTPRGKILGTLARKGCLQLSQTSSSVAASAIML
jgi:hypothetical protein